MEIGIDVGEGIKSLSHVVVDSIQQIHDLCDLLDTVLKDDAEREPTLHMRIDDETDAAIHRQVRNKIQHIIYQLDHTWKTMERLEEDFEDSTVIYKMCPKCRMTKVATTDHMGGITDTLEEMKVEKEIKEVK